MAAGTASRPLHSALSTSTRCREPPRNVPCAMTGCRAAWSRLVPKLALLVPSSSGPSGSYAAERSSASTSCTRPEKNEPIFTAPMRRYLAGSIHSTCWLTNRKCMDCRRTPRCRRAISPPLLFFPSWEPCWSASSAWCISAIGAGGHTRRRNHEWRPFQHVLYRFPRMGLADHPLFFLRRAGRRRVFPGCPDRSLWPARRPPAGSAGVLHRVPVHHHEWFFIGHRSLSALALLAHADCIQHIPADVQILVTDVRRLMGALDIRHFFFSLLSRSVSGERSATLVRSGQAAPAGRHRDSTRDGRRPLRFLCRRLHRSAFGCHQSSDLV